MASTQAAWRFYNHDELTLQQVFSPILESVSAKVREACDQYVLVACDWCHLHYTHHSDKKGRVTLAHSKDLGFELFSGLAVSDREGQPLGPLWIELRDEQGVHSTRTHELRPAISVLDEVVGSMEFTGSLRLGCQPVFVIDAESASIAHLRQWDDKSIKYIVRGRVANTAIHEGTRRSLGAIKEVLRSRDDFQYCRMVDFEGQELQQWVASTNITITRAARTNRVGEKRLLIPGRPLALRLIVSELRNEAGEVLAVWYLYTNLPDSVSPSTIVQWYYWRWRIEDFHKLLKSAGQEVEHWRQESGEAIARRLAVASMACLIVLALMRDRSKEGAGLREVLVRLSGRQMSRNRPSTAPALLAGLSVLLGFNDALKRYSVDFLLQCVHNVHSIIASNTT